MDTYLYLITYGSLAVFIVAVAARFMRIQKYPLNVRWELYPVPHEGARSEHGGSRLEDTDWWEKKQEHDQGRQLKMMLQEMVFIKALKEHNPKLWSFSFPFHFGLYMMAAFGVAVVVLGILGLAQVELPPVVGQVVGVLGVAGAGLSLLGGLGLLALRLTDVHMKPYTTFGHIFNLLVITATLGLIIAAIATSGWSAGPFAAYIAGMLTFSPSMEAAPNAGLIMAAVICASLLLAYIPLTHMSHFFVKWFTWDKIRWDDEPNVRGGRIEKLVEQALQFPVSWSGEHIKGDGKKSWADVATEEMKSE